MRSLAAIAISDLHAIQRGLRSGRVVCPLRLVDLQAAGLSPRTCDAAMAALAELDIRAVDAILELVLSERSSRPAHHVELVWTGPEARQSLARDTAVVVRDLFDQATSTVLIAGFRFDHGGRTPSWPATSWP